MGATWVRRAHDTTPELLDWEGVQESEQWKGILLGNGASRAVWERFAYVSLYETACSPAISPQLSSEDQRFFAALGNTTNFEHVLASLRTAGIVAAVLGMQTDAIRERYESIRAALIRAVHAVHVPWALVAPATRTAIRTSLLAHHSVFTTNYDLLLYWVMMADGAHGFKDFFWDGGFNPANAEVWGDATKVYFLHGALHLYTTRYGEIIKDRATDAANLLERFGSQQGWVPLIVSEGRAEDKQRSISRSSYLSFALSAFAEHRGPLVIFGHSLDQSDQHLSKAIGSWKRPKIAYGIVRGSDRSIVRHKARVIQELPECELQFFDAATHPLGEEALRVDAS